ncbi:hypothetical protein [Streptomyces sp. NPDC003077]
MVFRVAEGAVGGRGDLDDIKACCRWLRGRTVTTSVSAADV